MKYIKAYESYDLGGYSEIHALEYESALDDIEAFDFNEYEINTIKNTINKQTKDYIIENNDKYINICFQEYTFNDVEVTKLDDEYFYIEVYVRYKSNKTVTPYFTHYKCDQLNGLLQCIKDMI